MFDSKFLKATAERAVKTFAQTLLAILGTDAMGVLTADLLEAVQVAGAAALLSVLSSVVSSGFGKDGGPSLAGERLTPEILKVEIPVPAKPAAAKPAAAKPAAKKAPAKKATPKKK